MAPEFFGTIAKHLKSEQIVDGQGFERLIIENHSELALLQLPNSMMNWRLQRRPNLPYRPLSWQGNGAKYLCGSLCQYHFEHIWNRDYIDNVQITFAEAIGVEDRGATTIILAP